MKLQLCLLVLAAACTRVPKDAFDTAPTEDAERPLIVVTFNTGTSSSVLGSLEGEDGYGAEMAERSDAWYGNGLAWRPAVESTKDWFSRFSPDLVVFQEIFWSGDCAGIPEDQQAGFVCDGWQDGDTTVAQTILGDNYQVACHPGKPDKCAAVHHRVGTFEGCEAPFCLEGLVGSTLDGCGSGARVGRGVVVNADGDPVLQLTNIHGSSGLTLDDQDCRVAQIAQVFEDLGAGSPAISPVLPDIVMGDLNTDPGRFMELDSSAEEWARRVPLDATVPRDHGLYFISKTGEDAPGSYGGVADIDHVMADAWSGACDLLLLAPDPPHPVYAPAYFDHRPVVCELRPR